VTKNEQRTGFIKCIRMTPEQEADFKDDGIKTRAIIAKWSQELYGEVPIRQFRQDFLSGAMNRRLPAEVSVVLRKVEERGMIVLQHVAAELVKQASYFEQRFGNAMRGFDDFFQEACLGVLDANWNYDGSTSPITSHVESAKNRMKDMIRRKQLDTVYASEWDRSHSRNGESRCPQAFADIQMVEPEDTDVEDANPEVLWRSYNDADLEDFERALFKGYLQGDKFFLSATAKQFTNPHTGRPYTKTTATNRFHSAQRKVQKRYKKLTGQAA
jgi:DNA-directed RNA polymerase specialized sigma24 family protein